MRMSNAIEFGEEKHQVRSSACPRRLPRLGTPGRLSAFILLPTAINVLRLPFLVVGGSDLVVLVYSVSDKR